VQRKHYDWIEKWNIIELNSKSTASYPQQISMEKVNEFLNLTILSGADGKRGCIFGDIPVSLSPSSVVQGPQPAVGP
jgi:hypothetical protein